MFITAKYHELYSSNINININITAGTEYVALSLLGV